MTDITIIGSGNMARAIGTRAVAAGRSLQILSRTPEHAAKLAAELGGDTDSGGLGDIPEGDIVVLALYFGPAKEVATHYGDTLSGKTVVDISNPIDTGNLRLPHGRPGVSAAEEIAALLPGRRGGQGLQHHVRRPADGRSKRAGCRWMSSSPRTPRRPPTRSRPSPQPPGCGRSRVGGLQPCPGAGGLQLLVMALQANPAYRTLTGPPG